jgi:outer membrane protein assembly factor BamB
MKTRRIWMWIFVIISLLSQIIPTSHALYENGNMFRGDPSHKGTATGTMADEFALLWKYDTDHPVTSSPVVWDGVMYIGVYEYIQGFNTMTGELEFSYETNNVMSSTPTIWDGYLYALLEDGELVCVELEDDTQWTFQTDSYGETSSPTVYAGYVYFGSTNNKIYCLDADMGTLIWEFTTGDKVYSSPAVLGQYVYIGSTDGNVYCIDATNGDLVWEYATGGPVYSSPSVVLSSGRVYVGSRSNKLFCLDTDTGNLIWQYTTIGDVDSSPSISERKVYVGGGSYVYCINADDGVLIWDESVSTVGLSSPTVIDGKVIISANRKIFSLDKNTGSKLWEDSTAYDPVTGAAVGDGLVFVGSDDNYVYAFCDVSKLDLFRMFYELAESARVNSDYLRSRIGDLQIEINALEAENLLLRADLNELADSIPVLSSTPVVALKRGRWGHISYSVFGKSEWGEWVALPGRSRITPSGSVIDGILHITVVKYDYQYHYGSVDLDSGEFSGWNQMNLAYRWPKNRINLP